MKPRIQFQSFGAQLLQSDPSAVFYLSPLAHLPNSCVRGGQPIVFPQFADRGPLKKHGFAREVLWNTIAEARAPLRHRLILKRQFCAGEFADWPHEAELSLDVEYVPEVIRQTFEVHNIGRSEFSWTGGLHPYLAVDDLATSKLYGLLGTPYEDRYAPGQVFEGPEVLSWNIAPCEKLFKAAPVLTLDAGFCQIKLEASGFDQWMVWNPGKEGAKALADLPDEDWDKFVCVEPVCVDVPVVLKPGEKFIGKFNISIARSGIPNAAF